MRIVLVIVFLTQGEPPVISAPVLFWDEISCRAASYLIERDVREKQAGMQSPSIGARPTFEVVAGCFATGLDAIERAGK